MGQDHLLEMALLLEWVPWRKRVGLEIKDRQVRVQGEAGQADDALEMVVIQHPSVVLLHSHGPA